MDRPDRVRIFSWLGVALLLLIDVALFGAVSYTHLDVYKRQILGHERGFSASTIGLILGTFTLSVTLIRMLIPLFAQRLRPVLVLRSAMLATGVVFALYPLAPHPWLMGACAVALGLTLGSVQPMVMSMLHDLTPDQRHGETLAFRSMAINASSTVMPLIFGATGTVLGAAVLFWACLLYTSRCV